jgi:hypothetical protein
VFLDELTLQLLTAWLRERHRRWPASANPHLLVSRRTAMSPDGPPVSKYCLNAHRVITLMVTTHGRPWTARDLAAELHLDKPSLLSKTLTTRHCRRAA